MYQQKLIATLLLVFAPTIALAYSEDSASDRLSRIDTDTLLSANGLRCIFKNGINLIVSNSTLNMRESSFASSPEDGVVNITKIDRNKMTANLVGNNGYTEVAAVLGNDKISFIEIVPSGSTNIYTVYSERISTNGEFIAVTSRHSSVVGQALPSQYYGTCKVLE